MTTPNAPSVPAGYGLESSIVDPAVRRRAVERCAERNVVLPTFAQLADPTLIPADVRGSLADVDPDAADPRNLFRVNWYNDGTRAGRSTVPEYVVLPSALTGVAAPIIVVFGRLFPMIRAHKVLAAYSCLVPRLVTGQFDPTSQRAIWPSTGNYARGGVAISRLLGCRAVAVLPEGMSQERFDWLDEWIDDPADVIRTTGTESNVKEIYDACNELALDPANVILNQFCEYGNHLGHLAVTGPALAHVFEHVRGQHADLTLRAFTSASGSAGTIAAGDHLKDVYDSATVAVEALECPTLLYNGYGEHNIQGIGDKHLPLIHNITNNDVVTAISDQSTDTLDLLFNTPAGRTFLTERRGIDPQIVDRLAWFGFSAIANTLAAIKTAKSWNLGRDEAIITVATDGAELYDSERAKLLAERHPDGFTEVDAAAAFARHLEGVTVDHHRELTDEERNRMFNLGYFTWVEQQGTDINHFDERRDQGFWRDLRSLLDVWDPMIADFNADVASTG